MQTGALRTGLAWLFLLFPAVLAATAATAADTTAPPLLNSQYRAFAIPFHVTPAQRPEQRPREVFLHYSLDRGVTWKLGGRVDPSAGRFHFRAPVDGEYWFIVRTQLQSGKFARQNVSSPGLRVLIDTVQPEIQVTARRTTQGQVEARWQLSDLNLDADRFTLEYQAAQAGPWKPVPVDTTQVARDDGGLEGTLTWLPAGAANTIAIRGSVLDRAGNHAMKQVVVNSTPAPVAEDQVQTADKSTTITPPSFTPVTSLAGDGDTAPASPKSADQWPADVRSDVPLSRDTPTEDAPVPEREKEELPRRTPAVDELPEQEASPPPTSREAVPPSTSQTSPPPTSQRRLPPITQDNPPPTSQDSLPPTSQTAPESAAVVAPDTTTTTGPVEKFSAMQPRIVHSASFQLPYNLAQAGPGDLAKVDLWGTRDGGRTWTYFGTDIDQKSPFEVTVPSFGMYGFRILLHSLGGSRPAVPQPGDLPDMWVLVQDGQPGAASSGH